MDKYQYYFSSIFTLIRGMSNWPAVVSIFLGPDRPGSYRVHLRKEGLTFRVRGKMDIWSVKEAVLDRFYETYGFPIEDGWTVVDVGAGIGEFSLFAAAGRPNNRVYAFEPFPESYSLLRENLDQNRIENVITFPEAIWDRPGFLSLDLTGGEPLQLTSSETETGTAEGKRLNVPCICLMERLASEGVDRIDLLKIDCEGAEYPILFNLPAESFSRIRRIVMEYHDGVTPYSHQELAAYLKEQGYRVTSVPNVVHSDLGYLSAIRSQIS